MNEIIWPEKYLPGTTDNFVSNEVIVVGLTTEQVWPFLSNATLWPSYYHNASDIQFPHNDGPFLDTGMRFSFKTFGFPVEGQVLEYVPPTASSPARVAWRAWVDGDEESQLDVYHAWLIEDLPHNRVRILTQESQIGKPAQELARTVPNPMLNGHQAWLDGLVKAVKGLI